jgi:hypothetical protein
MARMMSYTRASRPFRLLRPSSRPKPALFPSRNVGQIPEFIDTNSRRERLASPLIDIWRRFSST